MSELPEYRNMNVLTERLLAEGYTKDYHPPNVRWDGGWNEFRFLPDYLKTTVWETPCGLLEKGSRFIGHTTSWQGIDYMPENNNPLAGCPYLREVECPHLLPSFMAGENCAYHFTRRPFDYEQSCKKLWDAWDKIQYDAREKATGGRGYCACLHWDHPSRSYLPSYQVDECIRLNCQNEACVITQKPRNLERVNIFYDLLRIRSYRIGFADYVDKTVEKGIKQFKRPVARTDAENWLKINGKGKLRLVTKSDDGREQYFSDMHGQDGFGEYSYFHYEARAQNVRILRRSSKDLMQDLRDVAEGVQVTHASDLQKEAAAAKRQRRDERQAAKKRAVERSNIKRWQKTVATGLMPDGSPCNEGIMQHCKKELAERGLLDTLEQITLWRCDDGENEPDHSGGLPELQVEDEDHAVHDEHPVLDTTA